MFKLDKTDEDSMLFNLKKVMVPGGFSKAKTLQILLDVIKYPINW